MKYVHKLSARLHIRYRARSRACEHSTCNGYSKSTAEPSIIVSRASFAKHERRRLRQLRCPRPRQEPLCRESRQSDVRDDGGADRHRGDDQAFAATHSFIFELALRAHAWTQITGKRREHTLQRWLQFRAEDKERDENALPIGEVGSGCVVLRRMHTYRSRRSSIRC